MCIYIYRKQIPEISGSYALFLSVNEKLDLLFLQRKTKCNSGKFQSTPAFCFNLNVHGLLQAFYFPG